MLAMRFEPRRLLRALALKMKVTQGEALDELDIKFLEEIFSDMARIKPMLDRYPEWHKIYRQTSALYADIMSKARENEGQ